MRRAVIVTGIVVVCAGVLGAAAASWNRLVPRTPSPWDHVPSRREVFSHQTIIAGPLTSGPEVTKLCLACHPQAARQVMQTSHWTWLGDETKIPGTDKVMRIGKRNLLNNFCIHAEPNISECSACHAGYGWEDQHYTFAEETNVDCLVCHDQTNSYIKKDGGYPAQDVDLVAVARGVGRPNRKNCGVCHFSGAGGEGVKHGDLDGSLYFPTNRLDVHMGQFDFQCVDCHKTNAHEISGLSMSVSVGHDRRVACEQCHGERPHRRDRLNAHTRSVACQACHIPRMAIDIPTQMEWDWSVAGEDRVDEYGKPLNDRFVYMKKKGSFEYAQDVRPQYFWWNGQSTRYLTGDKIQPDEPVRINYPLGGPTDAKSKIWPFKVHYQKQPFDKDTLRLLTPQTVGPGGYWADFNWDQAFRLGSQVTGVPYSGKYGFVQTEMYWPQSHLVQRASQALQCVECHSPTGLLEWKRLGFDGDPAMRGNHQRLELLNDGERSLP